MFDHRDWQIIPDLEIGNDDFIYGSYVDWDRFRYENEAGLLESFGVYLPWGQTITFTEYLELISQDFFCNSSLLKNYLEDNLIIEESSNLLHDIRIKFFKREDNVAKELVSTIFDYYGVPSGTEYEYELPQELQYWNTTLDDDYGFYLKYPIEVESYYGTIIEVFNKYNNTKDPLTKKSLLLASLIITESMFISAIVQGKTIETSMSTIDQEKEKKEINKIIRGNHKMKLDYFKKIYGVKAPPQSWVKLRNSLAHNIEASKLENEEISYFNFDKDKNETMKVEHIKSQLFNFASELKLIMDAQNYRYSELHTRINK